MKKTTTQSKRRLLASWQVAAASILVGGAAFAGPHFTYTSSNLDSDIPGVAAQTDPLLINPWGVVTGVEGNLHVSDDATGVSTLYAPDGNLIDFTGTTHAISIPYVTGTIGAPTGVADNQVSLLETTDSNDFAITSGGVTGPSRFVYVTEDGVVAGYNSEVSATTAITGTSIAGAGFTGVALSYSGTGDKLGHGLSHELFAADFAEGKVVVLSSSFTAVTPGSETLIATPFVNPDLPSAPAGDAWSPFNVHDLDYVGRLTSETDKVKSRRLLVVTYALHATGSMDDIPFTSGTGNGYVALFKTDGTFVKQLNFPAGQFSSPWGVAIAHGGYGGYGAPLVLLIGSHGSGEISAYGLETIFPDLGDKAFPGYLTKDGTHPLTIEGLWGLRFASVKVSIAAYEASGGSDLTEDKKHFYFSAGILGETHGLVGKITDTP